MDDIDRQVVRIIRERDSDFYNRQLKADDNEIFKAHKKTLNYALLKLEISWDLFKLEVWCITKGKWNKIKEWWRNL